MQINNLDKVTIFYADVDERFKISSTFVVIYKVGRIVTLTAHDITPNSSTISVNTNILKLPKEFCPFVKDLLIEGITATNDVPSLNGIRFSLSFNGELYLIGAGQGYIPQANHSFNITYISN